MSEGLPADIRVILRRVYGWMDLPMRECKLCGRMLWFGTNPKTGKQMPLTDEGTNHFADCPQADRFRRTK